MAASAVSGSSVASAQARNPPRSAWPANGARIEDRVAVDEPGEQRLAVAVERRLPPVVDGVGDDDVVLPPVAAASGMGHREAGQIEHVGAVVAGGDHVAHRRRPDRQRHPDERLELIGGQRARRPGKAHALAAHAGDARAVVRDRHAEVVEVVLQLGGDLDDRRGDADAAPVRA